MTITDIERPQTIHDPSDITEVRVPTAREINLAAQARAQKISADSSAPLDKRISATRDAAFFGRMAEQPSEDEMRAEMAANPSKPKTIKKLASQLLQNGFGSR